MSSRIPSGGAPRPNLFIVGVPKAGTTSLHHHLAGHPDVFMSRVKELHQFSTDLRVPPSSESAYLGHFREGIGCRWLGESTPLYMASEEAAARLARFNPEARIIILLREPIEMMYALYGQHLADCVPCRRDFETELRSQEDDRRRGLSKRVPGFLRMPRLLEFADYAPQIRRFYEHFPASQIRVILFDDLVADTTRVHLDLLRWLGIAAPGSECFPRLGSRREHVDPAIIRAVRAFTPITRQLRRVFPRVVDAIAALIRKSGTRSLPALDPALRARLQAEFFPDFGELESLIGQSLERWRLTEAPGRNVDSVSVTATSADPDVPAVAWRRRESTCRAPARRPTPSVLQPIH